MFLDRCAYLISLDNPAGLESEYKAMAHKVREIPASECPSAISDLLYSDRLPASDFDEDERFKALCDKLDESHTRFLKKTRGKRAETKFNRIEQIRKKNPAAKMSWVSVDEENRFVYSGTSYIIPTYYNGYASSENNDAMDRVLVVDNAGVLVFYDQNVRPMEI